MGMSVESLSLQIQIPTLFPIQTQTLGSKRVTSAAILAITVLCNDFEINLHMAPLPLQKVTKMFQWNYFVISLARVVYIPIQSLVAPSTR